jgi:hypothetical protein
MGAGNHIITTYNDYLNHITYLFPFITKLSTVWG